MGSQSTLQFVPQTFLVYSVLHDSSQQLHKQEPLQHHSVAVYRANIQKSNVLENENMELELFRMLP